MGWYQGLLAMILLIVLGYASFFSSDKAITVFEGTERVLIPLNVLSQLNFVSVEWRFSFNHKHRLLALLTIGENGTVLDKRFQMTENGSLVLKDAHLKDTGNYSCSIIFSDGTIQKHKVNLQVQPYNISLQKTQEKNSTAPLSPHAEDWWTSRAVIIACPAVAAVLLLAILSGVVYKCRKNRVSNERIYGNVLPGQRRFATTPRK